MPAAASPVPCNERGKEPIMLLDVEVTIIELDNDGDGSVDEELVIVEDVD